MSFELDLTGMLSTATSIFNSLMPIFGPILGITLGLGLLAVVTNEIRKAI